MPDTPGAGETDSVHRQIVEQSGDAVIATDRDGVIRIWNRGAETMLGYRADEVIGSTLDVIVPEDLRERHWQGFRHALAVGSTRYDREPLTAPALRRDGSRVPLEFRVTLLRDGNGNITGASAILHEIIEHWETLAHELRTPLTAVRSCIGLLRDPNVQPDATTQAQLLETIETSAERLQRLVADVLDLTRFRSGGIRLQAQRFDAAALARAAAASMSPMLQARGQHIELTAARPRIWVFGDRRQLERTLLNLLSNAQRFSPDGAAIQLSVTAPDGQVAWSVSDVGPGIAADDVARLFDRFFTMPPESGAAEAGTGLGLPIARAIAVAHGGDIEVHSQPGTGSTFTLRVPAAGPPHADER